MEKLDVVYLSPDLSSLFGAVLLAAGGLKVLVLEGEPKRTQTPDDKEEIWANASAEPFLLRGLRSGGTFLEPLLNRLGLLNRAREMVERIDPPLQVITPLVRVDMWSGREDMARELAREFGQAARNAAALFQGFEELSGEVYKVATGDSFPAVPKGISPRLFRRAPSNPEVESLRATPLSKVLADHSLKEPFLSFFFVSLVAFGAPYSDGATAAGAAALIDSLRRGIYRANLDELTKLIISTFKSRGGYTFPLEEMEAAEVGGKEITALRMSKSNYIKSRFFIGGAPLWAEYLPKEMATALLSPLSYRLHRLDVLLNADALPVGMKDRVAVLAPGANGSRPEHIVRIAVSPAFEMEGDTVKIVTAESSRPGTENAHKKLKESLQEVIPFLDEYIRGERYSNSCISRRLDPGRPFLELPPQGPIDNLLPDESELLAGMGLGDGVISGRILPRVILRKLGLRADI